MKAEGCVAALGCMIAAVVGACVAFGASVMFLLHVVQWIVQDLGL